MCILALLNVYSVRSKKKEINNMGTAKDPLNTQELTKMDNEVNKESTRSYDQKLYKLLRYTGMHSSCVYRKESNIREIDIDGITHIVWARPMKGAEKGKPNNWKDVEGVPKSVNIDFDTREFYLSNLKKKRNKGAWKVYINNRIKAIGVSAGVSGVSPNSLRHTFLMLMVHELKIPKKDVCLMAGCTLKTIDSYYDKLGKKSRAKLIEESGW
jgi:integrase